MIRMMCSQMKRIVINLSISGLSFILVLLLIEIALSSFHPQRLISHHPGMYIPDQDLGYRLSPDYIGTASSHEYRHEIRINSLGLRDREYDVLKPPETYRILILGDSFVFNYGIPYGQDFASILEKELNSGQLSVTYKSVEVINAGVSGYEPYDELKLYRNYLKELAPDLVIMGFYEGNDFAGPVSKIVSNPEVRQFNLKTPRGLLELVNDKLESNSHLYMFFRNRLEYSRFRMGLSSLYLPSILFENRDDLFAKTEEVFEEIAWEFRSGPKLFLFLIPHRVTVDDEFRGEILSVYRLGPDSIDISRPKVMFRSLIEEFHLKGIDLTSSFLQEEPSSLYYHIDGHWNVNGNRVAAKALFPHILGMIQ